MNKLCALVACLGVTVVLTACGSSDPKADILDGVRSSAVGRGLTQVQADCIVEGLRPLTVDQLYSIGAGTADEATTQAYTLVAAQCLLSK